MNGYELSRKWFDFCFDNPEKIKPNHSALYFFAIEHCNRLGWKEKFGFPTEMAKDAIGIKNYRTYINTLNDLVDWGFLKMIEKSKNQYSANIIALVNYTKATTKALDKASIKHSRKQGESNYKSTDSINKQETKEQLNNKPNFQEKFDYFIDNFNLITKRKFRGDDKAKQQFKDRLANGYTWDDFRTAITNLYNDEHHKENNFKYATPEFITRSDKLEMYLNKENTPDKTFYPGKIADRNYNSGIKSIKQIKK